MLRILVVSDSHGRNENVQKAINKAGKIDMMIHLGDVGARYHEVEYMAGVPTYIVAGNNDFYGNLLERNIIDLGGHRIFATHGHRMQVHRGVELLRYHALENDCDIALYGHTHIPFLSGAAAERGSLYSGDDLTEVRDVTIANPGSLTYPRQGDLKKTFLVMKIEENGRVHYRFDSI